MENKRYLNTLEAARLVSPGCTENSARSIISNLVKSGFIERKYPALAIVEDGKIVQEIEHQSTFFCAKEVADYVENVKQQNIKKYKAAGIKITAENDVEKLTFDDMRDAAFILGGSYRDLRYAVLKGGYFMGYKITKV